MKSLTTSLMAILMTSSLAIAVSAQQSSTSDQQPNQNMQGMHGKRGNMSQMMQSCRKNMQPMMQTNRQAKKDIESAKASNDPEKMRTALDEAEKAIDGMNTHMSTCMNMMNMMQKMHSGMMGNEPSKPHQ